jgi:hypothetical protein
MFGTDSYQISTGFALHFGLRLSRTDDIAAVLLQKHPGQRVEQAIAYTSRTLTRAELRYTTSEGELLALLHGLHAFRQYLAGRTRFLVRTDHWPLK